MTTKPSAPTAAAKKKLLARIAVAQRQADAAKKSAKVAKLGFRHARQKFKDAKRAAKKLRKAVKALKAELAKLAARRPARKTTALKPAARQPVTAAQPVLAPVETPSGPDDLPPSAPIPQGSAPLQ